MIGYLQLLGMLFNRELVDNRIEGLSIIICTYICNILLYIIDPMILYIYCQLEITTDIIPITVVSD